MLELSTARLRLVALDLAHLELRIRSRAELEARLGLVVSGELLDPEVERQLVATHRELLERARGSGLDYLWYTNWEMVLRAAERIVGAVFFKGRPDEEGAVEVGYHVRAEHRGRGYMTEALAVLARWALGQPGVRAVIASTPRDNLGSQRVLAKAGFHRTHEEEGSWWWRRARVNVVG